MRFRKKPVVIDAIQWNGANIDHIAAFMGLDSEKGLSLDGINGWVFITTLEGIMKAETGDWIIRGVKGEYYPCKPDIFQSTYEAIDAALEGK